MGYFSQWNNLVSWATYVLYGKPQSQGIGDSGYQNKKFLLRYPSLKGGFITETAAAAAFETPSKNITKG